MMLRKIILIVSFLFNLNAHAELSNKAVFHRCYKQITQTFPTYNNTLMTQVSAGTKDPIAACLEVLDKAQFTANGDKRIADVNDQEAKDVLRTMQSLHHSWLHNKSLPNTNIEQNEDMMNIVDYNGPSLFFTKALFDYNYVFKDIFTGNTNHLESDRTDNNPEISPLDRLAKNLGPNGITFPFENTSYEYAAKGELLGVREFQSKSFFTHPLAIFGRKEINLAYHRGGGVMGTNIYLMANAGENGSYLPNGGVKMFRKWSVAVFDDFLCREMPAVRFEDSTAFTDATSEVSFRKQTGCVRCHVTMDRASSVIRNVRSLAASRGGGYRRIAYLGTWDTTKAAVTGWPATAEYSFFQRATTGHFYFRTHDGNLIDIPLENLNAMGQVIQNIDAPYICAAKRYYQYFTGIKVSVDDIADPQIGYTLNDKELAHRDEVIQLGLQLKQHQSLRQLIEQILRKPQFKHEGYEIVN